MKQALPAEARRTLAALKARDGVTYATLGRVIDRSASYLSRFVRRGAPTQLTEADARQLAQFFGVDPRALGVAEGWTS